MEGKKKERRKQLKKMKEKTKSGMNQGNRKRNE